MTLRISFKTSPQGVTWPVLDATWRHAGELSADGGPTAFDGGWMNDHITDMDPVTPGPSFEAMTLLAALVHHVPGMRVGHAVLSNTFRHPVLVAKAATVLDHVTGGNFVLGLGAGWFEEEHGPFGLELPPIGERISRMVSAVDTIKALFSPDAYATTGVTRDDPHYPLRGATNLPAPLTPGGPPLFLGGQGPRGIRLAARAAQGWLLPGTEAGDDDYFRAKRDIIVGALEDAGRDPATFELVGQVFTGTDAAGRARSLVQARRIVAAGATEIVLGMPAALGPAGLDDVHRDLLLPLRDAAA